VASFSHSEANPLGREHVVQQEMGQVEPAHKEELEEVAWEAGFMSVI
jgi:hypothetical protein